ncbi:MAG: T9SS type A sorting domain-containing protein, partial [Candidatus Coatesbacteria bacterium]|nr:T9SS type A sorting domain-containing protein [Candidatus Coatesbacteria bacterium]
ASDAGVVELALYDLAGRRAATLIDGPLPAGRHVVSLDASAYAAGVYLLRLSAAGTTATSRLVITR